MNCLHVMFILMYALSSNYHRCITECDHFPIDDSYIKRVEAD